MFGAAAYAFYALYQAHGVNLWLSVIVAIAIAAAFGLLVDIVIYRTLAARGGGTFSIFIASLGVASLFEAMALLFTRGTPLVAHTGSLLPINVGPVSFRLLDLIVVSGVAVLYGALFYAVMHTRTGLEIRALADNGTMAGVVGIDTNRSRTSIFLIASAPRWPGRESSPSTMPAASSRRPVLTCSSSRSSRSFSAGRATSSWGRSAAAS